MHRRDIAKGSAWARSFYVPRTSTTAPNISKKNKQGSAPTLLTICPETQAYTHEFSSQMLSSIRRRPADEVLLRNAWFQGLYISCSAQNSLF